MKKINLGCSRFKKSGYINIDADKALAPDIVLDLNKLPYPFKDNSIDHVEANHILEHISTDIFIIMKELHRILKKEGVLKISVPHFSRGFAHPQH